MYAISTGQKRTPTTAQIKKVSAPIPAKKDKKEEAEVIPSVRDIIKSHSRANSVSSVPSVPSVTSPPEVYIFCMSFLSLKMLALLRLLRLSLSHTLEPTVYPV